MKKAVYKKIIKFLICIISIIGCMNMVKDASAASASINVTTDNKKVAKGDTLYVIITVSSSDLIGGFKGTFSYDSSILKYVTGGSVMSGNDSEFYLTDTERETGAYRIKYSIKFIARHEGPVSISLKKPYSIYKADDSSEMSVSFNPLNIMVVGKDEIKKETSKNKVKEKDGNDKKESSGNEKKDVSEKDKTNKSKNDEQKESSDDKKNQDKGLKAGKNIAASYGNSGIVITATDNYTVAEAGDSEDIPAGFSKTKISIDGHVVDAYAPDGNPESDYVLIYCRRGTEQPEFYLYDAIQNQFLPYTKVKGWYDNLSEESNAQLNSSSGNSDGIIKYVIICAVMLILALMVFIIYKYLCYKEKTQDDYIIENDYDSLISEDDSDSPEKDDNESEIFDSFSGGHSWKRQN